MQAMAMYDPTWSINTITLKVKGEPITISSS
jgi:hypothetical protein